MFKLFLIVLCLLFPLNLLAQEPSHRQHRHTRLQTRSGIVSGYKAHAVDFDAANDWLTRGADLTGNADGKKVLISIWFRVDGSDGSGLVLYSQDEAAGDDNVVTRRASNDRFRTIFRDTGGVIEQQFQTTPTYPASATWHHAMISFDLSVPECDIRVDDLKPALATNTCNDDTIDFTQPDHIIGALTAAGSSKFDGCLSEVYINLAEFMNLDLTVNRRNFIGADLKPVDLGRDGRLPTGTVPIIYLNGNFSNFQVNQGSGGDFTVNGALEACSTSPSDDPA